MNLQEKLQFLRKSNGLSQEELAEKLNISRQAVSKWESGQSIPDLNKIILLAELYKVTIDSLVRDSYELEMKSIESKGKELTEVNNNKQVIINLNKNFLEYEYKSKKEILGIPLIHINLGRGLKKAKGIIAIGNIAIGNKINGNQNLSLNASLEQVENLIKLEYPKLTERFIRYNKRILMIMQ